VICIVVAALAGYFVAGKYIAQASIGLDPSAFPLGELVQSIGVALFPNLEIAVGGLVLGTVLLVPIVVRRTARMPVDGPDEGRRGWKEPIEVVFGGEVVKTHPEYKEQWKGRRVRAYGRLGRTGWKVSDDGHGGPR
jgi:hypothetical protein